MDFTDKTVWITGASSGIGKAVALAFSEKGANLILSARNKEKLEEVRDLCEDVEKVKVLPLDLSDYGSIKEKTKQALSFFNGLDILFNNGGISQRSLVMDTRFEVDQQIFAVNYFGTIGLTKAVLPYFVKNQKGHIVVISSIMGKLGTPLRSAYAGSKHALHGYFDSLRAELFSDHIDVTLICPGYVKTDVSKNALTGDGTKFNKMDEATGKGLEPEELAEKALKAIAAKKQEVIIGGAKETAGVYMKRFFPGILSRIIRKINVT